MKLTNFWDVYCIFFIIVFLSLLLFFNWAQNVPYFFVYLVHHASFLVILLDSFFLGLIFGLFLKLRQFIATWQILIVQVVDWRLLHLFLSAERRDLRFVGDGGTGILTSISTGEGLEGVRERNFSSSCIFVGNHQFISITYY